MRVNADRLAAFERLLAQPDPRELTRGHRLTQPGKRDRHSRFWQACVRVWLQRQIGQAEGSSAVIRFGSPRFVRIVNGR